MVGSNKFLVTFHHFWTIEHAGNRFYGFRFDVEFIPSCRLRVGRDPFGEDVMWTIFYFPKCLGVPETYTCIFTITVEPAVLVELSNFPPNAHLDFHKRLLHTHQLLFWLPTTCWISCNPRGCRNHPNTPYTPSTPCVLLFCAAFWSFKRGYAWDERHMGGIPVFPIPIGLVS